MSDFLKENADLIAALTAAGVQGFASSRALKGDKEKRLEDAQDALDKSKKGYEQSMEKLRSRGITQETLDAIQDRRETSKALMTDFDAGQRRRDQMLVDAISRGDNRGAAGLTSALDNSLQTELDTKAKVREGMNVASDTLAKITQDEQTRQSGIDAMEIDRFAKAGDAAAAEAADTREALATAGPTALTNALQTGITTYGALQRFDPENPGNTSENGGRIKAEAGMRYLADEGFRTEGEFNHDTNKKAVVDEESGEKEAELTGNELVFNPKQVSDMENLIEDGDAKGLLEFMKELLSEPQFQK